MRLWLLWPVAILVLMAFAVVASLTVVGDWLTERLAEVLDWCLRRPNRGRADP